MQADVAGESPIHGQNPWPVQIPAFDAVLRRYIQDCLTTGQTLMQGTTTQMLLHTVDMISSHHC